MFTSCSADVRRSGSPAAELQQVADALIGRRRFLRGAAGAGTTLWLGSRLAHPARAAVSTSGGIDHVVVVMMENRSFDHFLGWMPNADGLQSPERRFPTAHGELVGNHHLTELMGCAHPDPDHSYEGGRFQLHGGRLDNFARGHNDVFAVGYYTAADRPFMSRLALNYTTFDRYFCGIMAETYPNRFYMHAGRTDRLHNTTTESTLPTIWDQLNRAGGPTGRYYFGDVPFLALWGQKYVDIAAPYAEFLADAAAGTLPNVSYVDPRFEDEGSGTSGDDHPHADIRAGDSFLAQAFHAVATGPLWGRTLFIVTYDEWGGFYDHVVPPRVTATSAVDKDLVGGRALLGYRVPCILASPFTTGHPRNPRVVHSLFDHTSILKLIESMFGLRPMTPREASRNPADPWNMTSAIPRGRGVTAVPSDIPASVPAPVVVPCGALDPGGTTSDSDTWAPLRASGLLSGWPV
jgi:phospholipase C